MSEFGGDYESEYECFLCVLPGRGGGVTPAQPLCMLQVNSSLTVLELRYNSDIDATAGQLLADAIMVRNA